MSLSMSTTFWVPLYTLLHKEIRRILLIWIQTLLPPLITMALYFIIFGQVIGAKVGGLAGVSYGQFIAPGIIALAMLTNTYSNASSSFFIEKFQHSTEELLVSSMSPFAIVMGFMLSSMFRGLLIGTGVFILAHGLTGLVVAHKGLTLLLMIASTAIMSQVGLLNALYAKRFDDVNLIPTFILTPLIYLGGIFYPIKQLPGIWQTVAWYNPIVYIIESFRYAVLDIASVHVTATLWVSCVITLILMMMCAALLRALKGVSL